MLDDKEVGDMIKQLMPAASEEQRDEPLQNTLDVLRSSRVRWYTCDNNR